MSRHRLTVALALLLAGVSTSALAQTRSDDTETPRGMALGSGVRASAAGTSAVDYNPANLPVARLYHIEAFSGWEPTAGRLTFGSALADSTTDYMHAGVAFRGILDTSGEHTAGFDGRVALAFPLGTMFAIGVAGRYASLTRSGTVPAGATNNVLFEQFTMDVAARVTPTPGLHIAAIGTNLLDPGTAIGRVLAPRLVGGSASYTISSTFTLGMDLFFNLSNPPDGHVIDAGYHWILGGGVEWLISGRVPLRAGYFYDKARDVHVVSGGIGYVDQKVATDIAIRQEVSSSHGDPLQTMLLLSFRYFVQ